MGAWGTGPFDNDTAADFAHDLRTCDELPYPPRARTAVLLDTMRKALTGTTELHPDEQSACELDYRVERAVAAVAYIADNVQGRCHHTNNPFARGVGDDGNLLPPVELEPVTDVLLGNSLALLDWIEHQLVLDSAGKAFQQELDKLRSDLQAYTPGG